MKTCDPITGFCERQPRSCYKDWLDKFLYSFGGAQTYTEENKQHAQNSILLLVANHESHAISDAVHYARCNRIVYLSFYHSGSTWASNTGTNYSWRSRSTKSSCQDLLMLQYLSGSRSVWFTQFFQRRKWKLSAINKARRFKSRIYWFWPSSN